jgi:hypothetical protein
MIEKLAGKKASGKPTQISEGSIKIKMSVFWVEISGSHGGEYEDDCLLGCFAV